MVRQTARLQTADLFQESNSQPRKHGICQAGGRKTLGSLLANTKLVKDSVNHPMINNFTSKAVAACRACLEFESRYNVLPGGLNAIAGFQAFYSVSAGYVWFLFVCLVRS